MITLQCCDGFAIHQHELATGINVFPHNTPDPHHPEPPLPPPDPLYPSRFSQSTTCGCPASCLKLTLIICFTYSNVHVGLHRTVQLQLLQHYWLGHRLGLLWYWMVCLGNEQRSFCCFWDYIQVLHYGLFCWPWWLLHFFWGIPVRSSRYNGHLS